MTKMRHLIILLFLAIIAAVYILYAHEASRSPEIVGEWGCDATAVFNQAYKRVQMHAVSARSVASFYKNGTYSSQDSATLVSDCKCHKGSTVTYQGRSKGTYSFKNHKGELKETKGERTMNGQPVTVKLPDTVSLQLTNSNSLAVQEDYGPDGEIKYTLHRQH